MLFDPGLKEDVPKMATPLSVGAVPSTLEPSENVTVSPLGMLPMFGFTVAVNVTS
jgi:hypothetical protein